MRNRAQPWFRDRVLDFGVEPVRYDIKPFCDGPVFPIPDEQRDLDVWLMTQLRPTDQRGRRIPLPLFEFAREEAISAAVNAIAEALHPLLRPELLTALVDLAGQSIGSGAVRGALDGQDVIDLCERFALAVHRSSGGAA